MVDELVQCCGLQPVGQEARLPALAIQYRLRPWQRSWMEAGVRAPIGVLARATGGRVGIGVAKYKAGHQVARDGYGPEASAITGLKALAQREGDAVHAVAGVVPDLLYRYSGSDIGVGVPIANRNRAETERLIGFVNTRCSVPISTGRCPLPSCCSRSRQPCKPRRTRTCRSSSWWKRCNRSAA